MLYQWVISTNHQDYLFWIMNFIIISISISSSISICVPIPTCIPLSVPVSLPIYIPISFLFLFLFLFLSLFLSLFLFVFQFLISLLFPSLFQSHMVVVRCDIIKSFSKLTKTYENIEILNFKFYLKAGSQYFTPTTYPWSYFPWPAVRDGCSERESLSLLSLIKKNMKP